MNLDKLEKLARLKQMGAISETEFEEGKKNLLLEKPLIPKLSEQKLGLDNNSYYMIMHLSQFCGVILPFLGLIVPVVLWSINKDSDPLVDTHGRHILNWNISLIIYLFICFILIFLVIGFFIIWIPLGLSIIFPIIGALKAKRGKTWKYPLSIPFF